MFHPQCVISGALFHIAPDQIRQNGPCMRGSFYVEGEHGRFNVSAWLRTASKGERQGSEFLSLELEPIDGDGRVVKVFGALYPSIDKRSSQAPDYTGLINLSREASSPVLRASAWSRYSSGDRPQPFLSVRIEPPRSPGSTPPTQRT